MKLTDRVRAVLLRLGIAYDEPTVLVIDDVVIDAMSAGHVLVLDLNHPPVLVPPLPAPHFCFPQPEPRGVQ